MPSALERLFAWTMLVVAGGLAGLVLLRLLQVF